MIFLLLSSIGPNSIHKKCKWFQNLNYDTLFINVDHRTRKFGLSKSLQADAVGTLYVTNKGIFYDGDKKNIKLAWDKIMRETINPDSIQLEKSNSLSFEVVL